MAEPFADLCLLGPDYQFLLQVAQAGMIELCELSSGQAFSARVLQHKRMAVVDGGQLRLTELGRAVSVARVSISDSGSAFIAGSDLATATSVWP